jgi:hypothetical protein
MADASPDKPSSPQHGGFLSRGIADLDAPIYRIFSLWALEEAFHARQLTLVEPELWEDPHELMAERIVVVGSQGEQAMTSDGLPPAYAQCWSANAESDTLFRAYSRVVKDRYFERNLFPGEEGVRVRSTSRKIAELLVQGIQGALPGSIFIGSVVYKPEADLHQNVANAIADLGPRMFCKPENRAKLLLEKRDAFRHEEEVRIIYVEQRGIPRQRLLRVPMNANAVFDEILLDPRLSSAERSRRTETFRALGYAGQISASGLYDQVFFEIPFPGDLPGD